MGLFEPVLSLERFGLSQMRHHLNNASSPPADTAAPVFFRFPTIDDGSSIWELVKASSELDHNSAYLYLLWCRDFHETTVVITAGAAVVGFAAGFIRPAAPNTLFIWQVKVAPAFRRRRLGMEALVFLIANGSDASPVSYVEATVTPDNLSSRALFRSLALALDAGHVEDPLFPHNFDDNGHPQEVLHRIGPIRRHSIRVSRSCSAEATSRFSERASIKH